MRVLSGEQLAAVCLGDRGHPLEVRLLLGRRRQRAALGGLAHLPHQVLEAALHGASLVADGARRVAVIVEPANPARISPLLMAAYGLSEREQDVTRLVLRGDSTEQVADTLCVSPHTVQQHLKSVFEKTGVRSRRELVGKVFFAHYEPRLRDNERRVVAGDPVRGGPLPAERH